jgi:hypothetical protein
VKKNISVGILPTTFEFGFPNQPISASKINSHLC